MAQVRVLILRAAGINCEVETAYAWQLAGAQTEIRHLQEIRHHPWRLREYQVFTIPGGFSYGDDVAAGKILANQLQVFLTDALNEFIQVGGVVLGICNGFQVLCKAGLLPGGLQPDQFPEVTITANVSSRYEDRWVHLQKMSKQCVFLQCREHYELPVAHGEGRVIARQLEDMQRLAERGTLALQYVDSQGRSPSYPANPNGSWMDTAGLCDATGRIFGLMPHPERYVHRTHHPLWTSHAPEEPHGLDIFQSAVESLR